MRRIARWPVPSRLAASLAVGTLGFASAGAQTLPNPLQERGGLPCVLDKCLNPQSTADPAPSPTGDQPEEARQGRDIPSRPPAPGAFDFYVLALSWSPGFCQTVGAERNSPQCEPGTKLGFVVHGLWPQNRQGYPADCDPTARAPSRLVFDSIRGLYPDEGLARHEWRRHGTCTGQSPTAYFADVRRARDAIAIPQPFQGPGDPANWAPLDIARAFAAANPRLRTDSMAVTCRQNKLEEVRICLTKDLRGFIACPEVARASCRRPIEVPPVL